MHRSAWFSTSRRPSAPRQRLFCLPHAGGGTAIYHRWKQQLPESVELVAVKLPGREDRLKEAPLDNLNELARQIAQEMESLADLPFSIFGHSMGAAIGYRVAVQLARRNLSQPHVLFVSSCRAPGSGPKEEPLHKRDDDAMLDGLLARYGSFSGGDPNNSGELQLMRLLAKTIRADLKMLETYEHDNPPPLDCEIVALGGTDDRQVSRAQLQGWQQLTSAKFAARIFPGHHFYLRSQEAAVVKTIVGRLTASV